MLIYQLGEYFSLCQIVISFKSTNDFGVVFLLCQHQVSSQSQHTFLMHFLPNPQIGKLPFFSVLIYVFSCFQFWVP